MFNHVSERGPIYSIPGNVVHIYITKRGHLLYINGQGPCKYQVITQTNADLMSFALLRKKLT